MADDRTKEIFWEVLELDPAARTAFLDRHCADDAELRARVEGLVQAHGRGGELFGDTQVGPLRVWEALSPAGSTAGYEQLEPGTELGPYRILSTAGSGGFGTVYLAEQTEPVERRVALKILHRGLDSDGARARFDAERQALARMEHPGIARVYDAGTTPEGRPFFAMEFVDGEQITAYCERHGLGLLERLRLLRMVCQAVQHAHQKGIVHRDLKPSNVMITAVDGIPQPKVIDFGVAKAIDGPLTQMSLVSVEGQLMGTPAYMSPEQAAGEVDVDTRTDVYALGALLYELLAGAPPFDTKSLGFAALLRAIAEEDPQRPSERASVIIEGGGDTSVGRVPFDLDWITMRCLEKDRGRRYVSANALAQDLFRYIEGLPVEAAPPSRWYRLRKLTRRHRFAVGASLALLLALAGGAVGTGIGLLRARDANRQLGLAIEQVRDEAERARAAEQQAKEESDRALAAERLASEEAAEAQRQNEIAQAINLFVTEDLLSKAVPSTERGAGRDVKLLEVIDVASESMAASEAVGGRFADKPEVAGAIRDILATVYETLGDYDASVPHGRRAVALHTEALGPEDPKTLTSLSRLSVSLRHSGDLEAAGETLGQALEAQRRVLGPDHIDTLRSELRQGLHMLRVGRHEDAYHYAVDLYSRSVDALGPDSFVTLDTLNTLGIVARQTGRLSESEQAFREIYDARLRVEGPEDTDVLAAMTNLAATLQTQRRYDEALPLLWDAYEVQSRLMTEAHPATIATMYNLASLALQRSDVALAEHFYVRAIAGNTEVHGPDSPETMQSVGGLARTLARQQRLEEAEELFRCAYEVTMAQLGPMDASTDSRRKDLAGMLFRDPEHADEVADLLTLSLESQIQVQGPEHPSTLRAMSNLAQVHVRNGEMERAEELIRTALEGFVRLGGEDDHEALRTESDLVGLYISMEDFERALELALSNVERGERALDPDDYNLNRARLRLGICHKELGQIDQARAIYERTHASLVKTRGEQDGLVRFTVQQLAELDAE